MKSVHLVIPDLLLPKDIASEVCAGLHLPALEKMLVRGHSDALQGAGLERLLCSMFGVPHQQAAPVAPISALFDGLGEGCWLRADPVHLRLQRDRLVLLPDVEVCAEEAGQLCSALNEHFAGQGMEFFAPHPKRWYVRLDRFPDIETVPLSQAAGHNVHDLLPKGAGAMRWHQVFNETQMVLHAHAVNEARESRGETTINSLWFWGGGCDTLLAKQAACGSSRQVALGASEGSNTRSGGDCGCSSAAPLQKTYDSVSSNEVLAGMFASAAGIPFSGWAGRWRDEEGSGEQLLVWTGLREALQRGDLAAWRAALQDFETGYAQPLWRALRAGKIAQLKIDILSGEYSRSLGLSHADAWAFWRRAKPLAGYSL